MCHCYFTNIYNQYDNFLRKTYFAGGTFDNLNLFRNQFLDISSKVKFESQKKQELYK